MFYNCKSHFNTLLYLPYLFYKSFRHFFHNMLLGKEKKSANTATGSQPRHET